MITVPNASAAAEQDVLADLDALAHGIADRGIARFEPALRAVGLAARDAGACALLVALVTDPTAAAVARERAFGRLAAQLARRLPTAPPALLCA